MFGSQNFDRILPDSDVKSSNGSIPRRSNLSTQANPAGPAAPPAPAAKAASPGAADGTAKIQQEFFDCAMHGRYQEMRRLAKHAAVDVNSIKIQGKAPLGIMQS